MRVHSSSVACGHGASTFRLDEQGECGTFDRNQVRLSTVVQKLRYVASNTGDGEPRVNVAREIRAAVLRGSGQC